jgi:glucuronyl/N-acetylglucosaminyl transferase EXT1
LAYCYFGGYRLKSDHHLAFFHLTLPSYLEDKFFEDDSDLVFSPSVRRTGGRKNVNLQQNCRMETCFDHTKCKGDFKVYVYPLEIEPSPTYRKILNVILESRYYTSDPSLACVFVLALDTLDRDTLSGDYVRNMQARIRTLDLWQGGKNHLIFNLYAGTWPDYDTSDLGFDTGVYVPVFGHCVQVLAIS